MMMMFMMMMMIMMLRIIIILRKIMKMMIVMMMSMRMMTSDDDDDEQEDGDQEDRPTDEGKANRYHRDQERHNRRGHTIDDVMKTARQRRHNLKSCVAVRSRIQLLYAI